ncbi:MAG: metallopeptidase family protein [Anaerolineae bacterium]
MALKLSPEQFEQLVAQALDELPQFFQEKLQNIEVVLQDWPTPAQLRAAGMGESRGRLLLGLYEGVPLTGRTSHYGLVLPDKITIFRGPIERICATEEAIARQVRRTVLHELAHHFGIDDERLRELGAY